MDSSGTGYGDWWALLDKLMIMRVSEVTWNLSSSATIGFSNWTLFCEVRCLIREFLAPANCCTHEIHMPPRFEGFGFDRTVGWKYLCEGIYFTIICWKSSAIETASQFSGLGLTLIERHFKTAAFLGLDLWTVPQLVLLCNITHKMLYRLLVNFALISNLYTMTYDRCTYIKSFNIIAR